MSSNERWAAKRSESVLAQDVDRMRNGRARTLKDSPRRERR
jgi:hypothetical protein